MSRTNPRSGTTGSRPATGTTTASTPAGTSRPGTQVTEITGNLIPLQTAAKIETFFATYKTHIIIAFTLLIILIIYLKK